MLIHNDGELATRYAIFVDDINTSGCDQKGNEHTKHAWKQLKPRIYSMGNRAHARTLTYPWGLEWCSNIYGYSILKKVYNSEEVDLVEVWVGLDLVSLSDRGSNLYCRVMSMGWIVSACDRSLLWRKALSQMDL